MKKKIFLILIFYFLLLLPCHLFAHSPSSIYIDYDSGLNVLVGQVNHSVLDPTEHYVNRVVISVNGSIVSDMQFDQQTDRDSLNIPAITLQANPGDVIRVTAYCNKYGSKTINYTVKDDTLN